MRRLVLFENEKEKIRRRPRGTIVRPTYSHPKTLDEIYAFHQIQESARGRQYFNFFSNF